MTLSHSGGMSAAAAKRNRKKLERELRAQQLRDQRQKLKKLRAHIRTQKKRRKAALAGARNRCRVLRVKTRERAMQKFREALLALREARKAEISAARSTCAAHRKKAAETTDRAIARALRNLGSERAFQSEMRRIEQSNRERKRALFASKKERRQESDDEVRRNIPHDLEPLFERVKRSMKGSDRMSRTEAFLRYAEENPHEVIAAQEDIAEAEIRRLIRTEAKLAKATRARRHYDLTGVPF